MTVDGPPVISFRSARFVEELEQACSTWGAFVLVDHSIDSGLMAEVLAMGHRFFDLSEEVKMSYNLQKHGAKWRGYMPVGGERSVRGELVDWKEGLYMGDEHPPDHPRISLPTFGSNVFPIEIPEMKGLYIRYNNAMKCLGDQMMDALSEALGLERGYLQDHVTRHEPVVLPRMFRYLPQANNTADSAQSTEVKWGIGRHSDYGLWTMILTDAPGLEFEHPGSGEWQPVPFVKGGIVMNVGDVLDRLTGGRFVSAYHRARNLSPDRHRLSLPFFYDPAWDARMATLPGMPLATPAATARWGHTKITCEFDGSVEYSEFLAKKVAKVFPDLVPESVWSNLKSTSEPSTRHALVVRNPDVVVTERVLGAVRDFYSGHPEIKPSHGIDHILAVYQHASKAVQCHSPPLSAECAMEIKVAALLHDLDDTKYFPQHSDYENARAVLQAAEVPASHHDVILRMVGLVSCSRNGNSVPQDIIDRGAYHMLIPRWSDRLEAVGPIGVVRCYQYNKELGTRPLACEASPRPRTVEEIWQHATPERFLAYQSRGTSTDMISHYYDKLLHVSCPPKDLVRNEYLERMADDSSKDLIEVCLRYGHDGVVDEGYILDLQARLGPRK